MTNYVEKIEFGTVGNPGWCVKFYCINATAPELKEFIIYENPLNNWPDWNLPDWPEWPEWPAAGSCYLDFVDDWYYYRAPLTTMI